MNRIIILLFVAFSLSLASAQSIPDIKMVEIPAGSFVMGGSGEGENFDEAPAHRVNIPRLFRMSATEITNAQFERFFPAHRELRGRDGVSTADDEAAVNMSWHEAMAFCDSLSRLTGRVYRLPTEAEWEYACRAGSTTPYYMGEVFPEPMRKEQRVARDFEPVSLRVAQFESNPFGLYDMHGNVEEWCLDRYGLYEAEVQDNPSGPDKGDYRVTRGGSHHTPVKYLRSSNRHAMLPDDRHSQTGFRIVESQAPLARSGKNWSAPRPRTDIAQSAYIWTKSDEPLYIPPVPYVIEPEEGSGVPFYRHNHQPAVTWCPNGDLLAIWFSANEENGREVTVLSSRLPRATGEWENAVEFFRVPDRNLTGSSLMTLPDGSLLHINGMEASGDWQNLAMVARTSADNGATWSEPRIIAPRHTKRHQVIAGPIITSGGAILQACDAGPGGDDGTALHISTDGGQTWRDQWDGAPLPDFREAATGSTIAGIHAGVVELADGSLLAMGRGNSIVDSLGIPRMPMSISHDMGRTWTYHASPFTPINGGQRLVLRRLNEGPLLLIAFTDHPERTPEQYRGMEFEQPDGSIAKGYGLYAALSYDDGATWPVRKLLTDGEIRELNGGAWTGDFTTDALHAEPRGYLCATQTPDNIIHLLSSRLHYQFNLKWLEQ